MRSAATAGLGCRRAETVLPYRFTPRGSMDELPINLHDPSLTHQSENCLCRVSCPIAVRALLHAKKLR